jgi:hypothetical protein
MLFSIKGTATMDPLEKLLQLYCNHPTEVIEGDGVLLLRHFQVPDADGLLAIPGYKEAFTQVSACARLIDAIVKQHPDPDAQVRASIRLLRRMIDDGEPDSRFNATRQLIEGKLYKEWPAPEQAIFQKKSAILEWRDFFVSYTNRDAPATNAQFRNLIKSCLGKPPRGEEDQWNYLARVITRHLRRYQGLSGFFDEDNLKVGETIAQEVDHYCRRAFALVQLIEPLALEREPPINWCFYEYSQFSGNPDVVNLLGNVNRHFFIIAGSKLENVRPANTLPAYQSWMDRIAGVRYISLENERNTTLRAKLKMIAAEILILRAQIVDAWIES